jgi:DNA polymerase III epsilon subunit family exonuclease
VSPSFARTFVLSAAALLVVGALVAAAVALALAAEVDPPVWSALRTALGRAAVSIVALAAAVVVPPALWLATAIQRHRQSIERIRHDLEVMIHANPGHRLEPAAARRLDEVCRGINALADRASRPEASAALGAAEAPAALPPRPSARPEFYGFDLFARGVSADLERLALAELPYTVFDTETTGLDPAGGDEIVAIGAVRVARGRIVRDYVFDCLVDPRRDIPALATRIHGIDAAQVAGCPGIESALPALKRFAADSVLVGHNVAFDLRFFELKAAASGTVFDMPVIDTLLLASIVDARDDADHTLEGLARRYGIGEARRHHALSDALVTAQVFLRMLPLLARRGIVTLGDALEASRRSRYARVKY